MNSPDPAAREASQSISAPAQADLLQPGRLPLRWYLIPLAIFVFTGAIFSYNAAPGVCFHDSGEFSLVAKCWGLTHPPGAPAWTSLAAPFVWLGHFADAARGANLFSSLMGAVTEALLYILAFRILQSLVPTASRAVLSLAALIAPLVTFNSHAFLEQTFFAEQYTLLTALLTCYLLILGWIDRTSHEQPVGPVLRGPCLLLGLVAGFAIGNHPSQLCLAFPTLLLLARHGLRFGWKRAIAQAGWILAGLAVGLLVFVWLPISGFKHSTMDAVRATNLPRFWWAITRQIYQQRSWSQVPDHFISELLLTYDFIGELSVFGFLLCLAGVFVLVRSRSFLMESTILVVVVYAAGMFRGFCLQKTMNLQYLWYYGVRDWHLPLYMLGAVFAAVGTCALSQAARARLNASRPYHLLISLLVIAILATTAAMSVTKYSMRHFTAPQEYIADLMSSLPPGSMLLANADNPGMMLGYYTCRTGRPVEPVRVFYTYHVEPLEPPMNITTAAEWTPGKRVQYLRAIENPAEQPLYEPRLSDEQITSGALFTDHFEEALPMHRFMLPHGYLFQMQDHLTTTPEVLKAEADWNAAHPEGYRRPKPGQAITHFEAEARGYIHWQRAVFLHSFDLWDLARAEYRLSLEWLPNNARAWFGLGQCLQSLGVPDEETLLAYTEALHWEPWLPHVRINMAIIQAHHANLDKAVQLLEQELKIVPGDPLATEYLKKFRKP